VVASLQSEKLKMEELLGIIQEKVTTLEGNHAEAINENSSLRQSLITNEDHLKLATERFQRMKSEYDEVIDSFYSFCIPYIIVYMYSFLGCDRYYRPELAD